MTEPELPDAFTLWGVEMRERRNEPDYFREWSGHNYLFTCWITVSEALHSHMPPERRWSMSVRWYGDHTMLTEFGPTFAEAKRATARLLSERSREVGRT
jgi:hypothetical protein